LQGASILLGEMFTAAGAEVRYSMEADNDDTIASYAQLDGAAVLSRDRDFFRYDGSTFPLFFTFEVTNGDLNLKGPEHCGRSHVRLGT
jgi:hypothetical protein